MMRALTLLTLFALTGCNKQCKDGTILLSLTFDAASQAGDQILVDVATSTGTLAGAAARRPTNGTLEVSFGGGYPAGAAVTITVRAMAAGNVVGQGSAGTTLSAKCATLDVNVTGAAVGALDFSMPGPDDLGGAPDLSPAADLATCVPANAAQTVYVDPTVGHDDATHGAAPGGCAYKTITYALSHSTGRVNLLNTATYSTGETFPLQLNGTQILDGDPAKSGTRAHLAGLGGFNTTMATVVINGSANQLLRCDVTVPAGTGDCVYVVSSGAHIIDGCNIHACSLGIEGNESSPISSLTITSNSFDAVSNCINALGTDAVVKHNTCNAGNDGINNCSTNLTGCGNTFTVGTAPCNSCTCPSNFFSNASCP